MSRVVLYAKNGCGFCTDAANLLHAAGIAFETVTVGEQQEILKKLSALIGEPAEKITVPKVVIGDIVIRSSEELRELHGTSALKHLARESAFVAPRQWPACSEKAVCILHTGSPTAVWLAELEKRLLSQGAAVCFVDAERLGGFDLAECLPYSVVVNRVSDAAVPPLARFVASYLSFCASQRIPVVNGATAYTVATSKIAQHAFFHSQGLATPKTVTVRCVEDVDKAIAALGGRTVLFKPNAGSFGKGIVKFDDMEALRSHAARPSAYGNDGIALLQLYHNVPEVHRVFVLDGQVQCGVSVSIEEEQFTGQCMASAQKRRRTDGASAVRLLQVPDRVKDGCQLAMAAAHADVGSIEYLVDSDAGEVLYYDLNLLSTFPSESVVGKDCWAEFAQYIISRARRE